MAPKRKFQLYSDAAGPSRLSICKEFKSRFPENLAGPSILKLEAMIKAQNCKIEELKAKVDEVEEKLLMLQNSSIHENKTTREPVHLGQYKLMIIGNIKKRVYTGCKVHGQDGKLLKVAIYHNGEKIISEPLAFAKFEVLVVEGNFSTNDQESWTPDEFQASLVKARTEACSVLAHPCRSEFSNGEAVLDGLIFKDNSSWAVEKKWRLGIRILGSFNVRVQEAISNPFRVLDRHGKASEKPDIPLLEDGVECLERVGNKRASTLKKNKIYTVKDFLQLYHKNQTRLQKILGIKSEFDISWKTMIRHAKKCDPGSNLYSYPKKKAVLFFNCVYEVVGAEFGNRYRAFEKLRVSRKILVNKWKKGFYKKIKFKSFVADFKFLNGQPVPIECNFSGHSTDDAATHHDAGLQNRQPTDVTLFPDVSDRDIGRDVDDNIESGHNTTQSYYIPGLELPDAFQDMPVNSVTFSPLWDPEYYFDYPDVPKDQELQHAIQDKTINSVPGSPISVLQTCSLCCTVLNTDLQRDVSCYHR